jgi:hypothetical protein
MNVDGVIQSSIKGVTANCRPAKPGPMSERRPPARVRSSSFDFHPEWSGLFELSQTRPTSVIGV